LSNHKSIRNSRAIVASKAIRGLGSSAYSAYKGVRRYLSKPRSYKPRKPKTSSKRRSDLDYKKWERDMRKPLSSRVHLKFYTQRALQRVLAKQKDVDFAEQ
jgi:hypothetical protein